MTPWGKSALELSRVYERTREARNKSVLSGQTIAAAVGDATMRIALEAARVLRGYPLPPIPPHSPLDTPDTPPAARDPEALLRMPVI